MANAPVPTSRSRRGAGATRSAAGRYSATLDDDTSVKVSLLVPIEALALQLRAADEDARFSWSVVTEIARLTTRYLMRRRWPGLRDAAALCG